MAPADPRAPAVPEGGLSGRIAVRRLPAGPPSARAFEIPINMWGFLALGLYGGWTGIAPAAPSLCLMLGLFSIWTETALLERRTGLLSQALQRKARLDDPMSFAGAILGVVVAALTSPSGSVVRGAAVPLAMAVGSFLLTFLSGLDWRRSLLSAILVVYNGTGGAILRTAMTLAVWGNIMRSAGS